MIAEDTQTDNSTVKSAALDTIPAPKGLWAVQRQVLGDGPAHWQKYPASSFTPWRMVYTHYSPVIRVCPKWPRESRTPPNSTSGHSEIDECRDCENSGRLLVIQHIAHLSEMCYIMW